MNSHLFSEFVLHLLDKSVIKVILHGVFFKSKPTKCIFAIRLAIAFRYSEPSGYLFDDFILADMTYLAYLLFLFKAPSVSNILKELYNYDISQIWPP